MINLAINGFGRIGRMLLRAYLANPAKFDRLHIVAINDVADPDTLLHLLRFDSTHGRLECLGITGEIAVATDTPVLQLYRHGTLMTQILLFCQKDPQTLPWASLNIDVVLECTGHFRSYQGASLHRSAGAKQVIIGAAPFDTVDASIVMGVNDNLLSRNLPIISGVSCTTQALVPLLHVLQNHWGIDSVMMTEIHAVTADQTVLDQAHRDPRRGRASGHNIIPTTSSSIHATERVLPELVGKLCGYSVRVPTINVACIDVTVILSTDTDLAAVKQVLKQKAQSDLQGILQYNELPLVSGDFIGDSHSLIVDDNQLMQAGKQLKLFAWYDNEVGYANRLLDMCQRLALT